MGTGFSSGCCSCRTSHAYQVEERARGRGHETVRVVSIGERRDEQVVLRVLGQIWQLVKEPERDRDELVWKPCHLSDVHLKLTLVEDDSGDVLEYVLEEENNEVQSLFTAHLTTDSEMIRTGDQFVQWKGSHGSSCVLYGVSFISTRDTLRFISACTALFPGLQDKIMSPVYPPPPQSLLSPSHKQAPPTYTSTPLHPNHHITSNQIPLSSSLDWSLSVLHTSNTSPDNKFHRSNSLTLDGEGCQLLTVRRKDEDSEVPSARWHTGVEQQTLGDAYQTALSQVEGSPEQNKLTHSSSFSSMDSVQSLKKSDSQISEDFEGEESDSDEEDDEEGVVTSIDDAEYPELFQPTQALEVNKILEDIMEEEEEDEEGERRNGVEGRKLRGKLRHSSIRQTRATSELGPVLQDFDQLLNDLRASQLLELTTSQRESYRLSRQSSLMEPPVLPSSQPPGSILAPQRSLVPDPTSDRNRMSIEMTPELRNALSRLSTISLEGNVPPLLPISPPPGQRLSPEPSMTFEQYHQKPRAAQSIEEEDEETEKRPGASNGDLPPPLERGDSLDESHNSGARLRLTPSFLRSITPPEEFGDSGVPVTSDEESGGRHSWLSSRQGHVSQQLFKRTSSQMSSELSEVEQATGSIRKTGWLEVKGVLVRKNKKVAMKSKRRWKKYWTVMKGLTVLLHQCDKPSELEEDAHADLRLDIERCLVTPLLDHLTRDHVFCISTNSGNTYYLQTASQGELDDWITVLHSAAGIAMTMKPSKQAAAGMLETLLVETNLKIDEEERLRKMAELQLMAVSDYTSKSNITKQLAVFAENLEYLNMELFRIKCYLAALQGTEQPNPQLVLATVSKPTKSILSKVGVFSVSSLHAVVSCRFSNRSPVDQHSLTKSSSSTTLLSPGKWKGLKLWRRSARSSSQSTLPRAKRKLLSSSSISKPYPSMDEDEEEPTHKEVVETELAMRSGFGVSLTVELPNNKTCVVPLRSDMTVQHILLVCCKKAGLDPDDHFIRLKTVADEGQFLCESPRHDELLGNLYYSAVEVCQKSIRTVCISQPSTDGGTTTGVGVKLQPLKGDHSVLSKLLVVGVVEGSLADRHGICENDEILLINDTAVNQLTLPEVKTAFKEPSISITVRSCQVEAPFAMPAGGNLLISDLVCPAPPSHGSWLSKETLGGLIVPKPYLDDLTRIDSVENLTADDDVPEFTRGRVTDLIKGSLEVTGLVDRWRAYEMAPSPIMGDAPRMTREQRLLKVVRELLETERDHVKSLELTLERYLDPLQVENFIPHDEMSRIHAGISHITDQQRQFLQNLENLSSTCEEEDKESTKVIVLSVVTEFLSHMETFRQYSHFCASRHRLGQLMAAVSHPEQLQLFLDARNPKGDPTMMLESLLIRPIVRVMRYSLFLQAMKELSENGTDERIQLTEAITAMTQVARYINEVQKVSELYAHLFDDLLLKSGLAEFGVSVQVSQLLYHSVGMWLSHGQTSKGWKKGQGPKLHCFVFTTAVVLLSIDREHQRRGSKGAGQSSSITIDDVTHSSLLPLPRCKVEDLPDSDGVTNMWQILYQHNGQLATYLIRSSSLEEKGVLVHVLRKAIQDQVALYGSLSLPVSPVQSAAPSLYTGQSSPSCDDHTLSSPRTITTPTALSTDSDNEQTFL